MNGQPRVIVTVGTDHHPFDRLMRWIDDLVRSELVHPRDILVQSGSSAPPRYAPAQSTLPRTELLQLMARADVVIGHGGPGTVMDARSCGRRPIVVPRLAVYGEVVDDHQVTFARRLADLDKVALAENQAAFTAAVARGLQDPAWLAAQNDGASHAGADEVARRLGQMLELLQTTPRPQVFQRIRQLWGRKAPRDQAAATRSQPKSRSR